MASKQDCNRCCKLAADAERWFKKYIEYLIDRARSEKGRIFSIVVTRDMRRLFNVEVCPVLAAYLAARLLETGCVKQMLVKSIKSTNRRKYRFVLDKECVMGLQAKHL